MENCESLCVGSDGKFKAAILSKYKSSPKDVDDLFQKIKSENKKHLVIHFHGGLVNETAGMETADRMHDLYSTRTEAQAYAFIWKTGLMETFRDNLTKIHQTKLFRLLLEMILKKVGNKFGITLGGKGLYNLSNEEFVLEMMKDRPFENMQITPEAKSIALSEMEDEENLERELQREFEIMMEMEAYEDLEIEMEREKDIVKSENLMEFPDTSSKGIISTAKVVIALAKIGIRVAKRILNQRDHGPYPTVVEEIFREIFIADLGSFVWSAMKEKAEDMWKSNNGLQDLEQHAGTYFLNSLNEYNQNNEPIVLDLVGHSAGSIVICNLLKAIDTLGIKNIKIRKIIFLAPACRCDLFKSEVVDHPERFKDFYLFTMNDELETHDALIKGIYTRSLLYLVSGCLEDNGKGYDEYILGIQRHIEHKGVYSDDQLLKDVHQFLYKQEKRIVYSPQDLDQEEGYRCIAYKHGDFDNLVDKNDKNLLTLDSLAWHINN
jgi:hypothetical protein